MIPPSYVLVSGGAGGIGSALCRLLPASGFTPIVGYRSDKEEAEMLALECGGFAVKLDLASDESIAQSLAQISEALDKGGRICGVVLAASPPPDLLPFGKLTPEMLLHQFRINVVGPQLLLAGLVKTYFRKNKSGVVVGILSEAMGSENHPPMPAMGAYVIAKTALRAMLSVCAAEYPWLHVRTVSPGFTKTRMLDVFDERYLDQMQTKIPFASAEDVARRVLREIVS
jgi:NAD(P)-dependent dehydrogenase (short-subunit alcohol dehydrogenase family)